ncbi:putative sugar uptake protein [Gottschalkia acidurici 9a]|uniref:Sugar uptake protein n=1 Tax=Gottschalkia acidurici (strain ATCC 7906 / DSM 604 / BCRC 14475 / CIP 104303 / KCTC 5404 / NCIMB 10678 / 9a) TaxID=1128398 RepID=K0B4E2_GOTA9|nr:putative sugar uptake protein [Gottschalkia acidurici 9a]
MDNLENVLFGLIPALMWGIQPIIMTKIGGRPTKKVMGMALGIFIVSLIVFIFKRPQEWTTRLIIISLIDGIALSYGLINQIKGFSLLGISRGMPISTGTQLVGAALFGVLYFKEWSTVEQYMLGIAALILIILGVTMTTLQENNEAQIQKESIKKGLITLILSSLGFVIYTVILRIADITIWDALLPQAIGMLIGSYFLSKREDRSKLFVPKTFQNILTGFIFAIANITLMISNVMNGLAIGFTLTQMNVVIATIGGLIILKESKTPKEFKFTIIGLLLVVLGGILIGITKR